MLFSLVYQLLNYANIHTEFTHVHVLHVVSGYVRPGQLLAIMGASGAGKSTLLNALTFRNLYGLNVMISFLVILLLQFNDVIFSYKNLINNILCTIQCRYDTLQVESGIRYANGIQVTPNSLTSVSAYIQQDDLFMGSLTVREHLTFQACVRMDRDIPYKQRMERVKDVAKEVRGHPIVMVDVCRVMQLADKT